MSRTETRKERYWNNLRGAVTLPLHLVSVNFHCDENLAFLIRTAACFGVRELHVIGSIPPRKVLHNASGSLVDFVKMRQYSNPSTFLNYARENNFCLVSAEIADNSCSLFEYDFDLSKETAIVLGNETTGVPTEILLNSDIVHIPMNGLGYCLNTSQSGTAFTSEYVRQYFLRNNNG